MQIVTLELLSEHALELLRQLEQMHVVRLLAPPKPASASARQWAGSLPQASTRLMLEYAAKSRQEWERNT